MTSVRLEKVYKVFDTGQQSSVAQVSYVALDGVNLRVRHGETLVVLGPSGCGKSTLLRVVAGLTSYQGHVYYDDQLMDDVKPARRNIGMVFQSYALYPHLDGMDNLRFTFSVRKRPPQEAKERVRITSEIMGIGFDKLLKHQPGQLSGGEQQRLAVGRALVRNPSLFLFDEPLSNLDAKLRVRTRSQIKRLLQRFGNTSIYVTHDQAEATALGDRLAIMRAGRVEQVGRYADLNEKPINAFVASFLGNPPMTLLRGQLNAQGDWQQGDLEIPVPEVVRSRMRAGWTLIVGIRPEHARLANDETPMFCGRVAHIERDLPRRVQTLFVEHPALPSIAVAIPSDERVLPGDHVPVLLPLDKLSFFDGKTELRIG